MNWFPNVGMRGKSLLSAVLLTGMALGLTGCPEINELLGDAPFNGVYCGNNDSRCGENPDRSSSSRSSSSSSTGTSGTAPQ